MPWCATTPLPSPPATPPRCRCSKFGFGKVPGGGYKPEKSRGEILCFFYCASFLSSGREDGTAMDKIWQSDPRRPVNYCQPIRRGGPKDLSNTGSAIDFL